MGPISMGLCWPHVPPSQLVQASDVGGRRCICRVSGRRVSEFQSIASSSSSDVVDRYEDRHYDNGEWYEDYEERLQISEKKVGVETALIDDLSVSKSKY